MMTSVKTKALIVTLGLLSTYSFAQELEEKKHSEGKAEKGNAIAVASNSGSYSCKLVEYESEKSDRTKDVGGGLISIPMNGSSDPVPRFARSTGNGDSKVDWYITRYEGLISVEAKDHEGKSLGIATTADGSPIGFKIPGTKNILSCNPPMELAAEQCMNLDPTKYGTTITETKIDPKKYGERIEFRTLKIDPKAYGESIQGLDIKPRSYGAYITHQKRVSPLISSRARVLELAKNLKIDLPENADRMTTGELIDYLLKQSNK